MKESRITARAAYFRARAHARRLRRQRLEKIYEKIAAKADTGAYYAFVDKDKVDEEIRKELEDEGFSVTEPNEVFYHVEWKKPPEEEAEAEAEVDEEIPDTAVVPLPRAELADVRQERRVKTRIIAGSGAIIALALGALAIAF